MRQLFFLNGEKSPKQVIEAAGGVRNCSSGETIKADEH